MTKSEYDASATDGKSFEEFIAEFLEKHQEVYNTEEFNVIIVKQKPAGDMPTKIALSIVLEHKESEKDTTDDDVVYKI